MVDLDELAAQAVADPVARPRPLADLTRRARARRRRRIAGGSALAITLLGVAAGGGALLLNRSDTAAHTAEDVVTGPSGQDIDPRRAERYAADAFAAWLDGDEDELTERSQPTVAQFLLILTPGDQDPPPPPRCERGAEITVCAWNLVERGLDPPVAEGFALELRVDNELASADEPGAVFEAALVPSPNRIAVWYAFRNEQDAWDQQSEGPDGGVDAGHSPWLTSSDAVITFFATNMFQWPEEEVELAPTTDPESLPADEPAEFQLTNTTTGLTVDFTVFQPARQGEGGIWAIRRAEVSEPPG